MEDNTRENQRIKIKEKAREKRKAEKINKRANRNRSFLRKLLSFSVTLIFIIFIMSGAINQRDVMTNIVNFGRESGSKIGKFITSIITNKNEYIEINEDGVYLSDEIIDK